MSGIGALIIIILVSSIPAVAVFAWFRFARYAFSLLRFSSALLAGAASFFPALILQNLFAAETGIFAVSGKWSLITKTFIRIALAEEISRLLLLIILFCIIRYVRLIQSLEEPVNGISMPANTLAAATGLIAGFGFAVIENAVLGISNPENILLRTFTATFLHGSCGYRVGSAIALFRNSPFRAFIRFLSAVAIHGAYNFMLEIPNLLSLIFAILIVFTAFISSILTIYTNIKKPAGTDSPSIDSSSTDNSNSKFEKDLVK